MSAIINFNAETGAPLVIAVPPQAPSLIAQNHSAKFEIGLAMESSTTEQLNFHLDPWFPRGKVVGAYGRGGTAKSTLVASLLASISQTGSSLWVSSEEQPDWIKTRHIKAGGRPGTLAVPTVVVRDDQRGADGRPIASSFGVYADLKNVIIQTLQTLAVAGSPPLQVIVLDAIVALVDWAPREQPNADADVKRVICYLEHLAQKFGVTIWMIGHANKSQGKSKYDELSDGVMGAKAWTDSPRLSFMHYEDKREENSFVVYTIKTNLGAFFAQDYSTTPIHVLHKREGHNDSVLCGIDFGKITWGRNEGRARVMEAILEEGEGEGDSATNKKQAAIDEAILAIHTLVKESGTATRAQVEAKLNRKVNTRHWAQIETTLALVWKIQPRQNAHNQYAYCKVADA